jgi:hypothetical protein
MPHHDTLAGRTPMKCEACSMKHDEICFTVIEPDLSFASASFIGKVSHNYLAAPTQGKVHQFRVCSGTKSPSTKTGIQ